MKNRKLQPVEAGPGNDGLWKEWKNEKTVFPLFPQPLEIAAAITTFPLPRLLRAVKTPAQVQAHCEDQA